MPRNRSFKQILDSITDSESVVSRHTKAQHELEDMIQQEGEEESESFTEQLGRLNL
ncbi:15740_t:CDS:2, partial [Racocetra fulgida]